MVTHTAPPVRADFRACEVSMSDEDRIKLMSLVRDGKMSVDDAVKEVCRTKIISKFVSE